MEIWLGRDANAKAAQQALLHRANCNRPHAAVNTMPRRKGREHDDIGASLRQVIAGAIVQHCGFHAGFLFLVAVALAAFGILYFYMPKTRDKQFLHPAQGAPTP